MWRRRVAGATLLALVLAGCQYGQFGGTSASYRSCWLNNIDATPQVSGYTWVTKASACDPNNVRESAWMFARAQISALGIDNVWRLCEETPFGPLVWATGYQAIADSTSVIGGEAQQNACAFASIQFAGSTRHRATIAGLANSTDWLATGAVNA